MKLRIAQEVQEALEKHQAVVALESTIISHGMPYPKNLETAYAVEAEIRKNGAIPATIGIIKGECVVGLSRAEIAHLAYQKPIAKVSRRDLPIIVSKQVDGATTVAATMILASLAKIKVFVTGGIGGVHRQVERHLDISADLNELAKTNVAVVCAGPKSILDLPKTLEYLETLGVPVLGYQTNELPAFYTSKSGIPLEYRVETPQEIAAILFEKWGMHLRGGVLITQAIPTRYELKKEFIDAAINLAMVQDSELGIQGKELTPFLLKKIQEETNGESIEANIALILHNASLGAKIAVEYAKL